MPEKDRHQSNITVLNEPWVIDPNEYQSNPVGMTIRRAPIYNEAHRAGRHFSELLRRRMGGYGRISGSMSRLMERKRLRRIPKIIEEVK